RGGLDGPVAAVVPAAGHVEPARVGAACHLPGADDHRGGRARDGAGGRMTPWGQTSRSALEIQQTGRSALEIRQTGRSAATKETPFETSFHRGGPRAMPTFKYEVTDTSGGEVKDTVDALNEEEAQQKIRQMGYFVTKISEVATGKKGGKKMRTGKRKKGQV